MMETVYLKPEGRRAWEIKEGMLFRVYAGVSYSSTKRMPSSSMEATRARDSTRTP